MERRGRKGRTDASEPLRVDKPMPSIACARAANASLRPNQQCSATEQASSKPSCSIRKQSKAKFSAFEQLGDLSMHVPPVDAMDDKTSIPMEATQATNPPSHTPLRHALLLEGNHFSEPLTMQPPNLKVPADESTRHVANATADLARTPVVPVMNGTKKRPSADDALATLAEVAGNAAPVAVGVVDPEVAAAAVVTWPSSPMWINQNHDVIVAEAAAAARVAWQERLIKRARFLSLLVPPSSVAAHATPRTASTVAAAPLTTTATTHATTLTEEPVGPGREKIWNLDASCDIVLDNDCAWRYSTGPAMTLFRHVLQQYSHCTMSNVVEHFYAQGGRLLRREHSYYMPVSIRRAREAVALLRQDIFKEDMAVMDSKMKAVSDTKRNGASHHAVALTMKDPIQTPIKTAETGIGGVEPSRGGGKMSADSTVAHCKQNSIDASRYDDRLVGHVSKAKQQSETPIGSHRNTKPAAELQTNVAAPVPQQQSATDMTSKNTSNVTNNASVQQRTGAATPAKRPASGSSTERKNSQESDQQRHFIVLGRCGNNKMYLGNTIFRTMCNEFRESYNATPHSMKKLVVDRLIGQIAALDPPGKFVELDDDTGQYIEVSASRVKVKVGQALREKRVGGKSKSTMVATKDSNDTAKRLVHDRMAAAAVYMPTNMPHPQPQAYTNGMATNWFVTRA